MQSEYLNKRVDRRFEEREREENRKKIEDDNLNMVKSALNNVMTGFICSSCDKEYAAMGQKHIGNLGGMVTGWYVGKCPCGSRNLRRITDGKGDKYFFKAKSVRRGRVINHFDMIDPRDPLFKVLYPKQWRKMEEKKHGGNI